MNNFLKMAVLGNRDSWYVERLCREFRDRGHQAIPCVYPELHSKIMGGRARAFLNDQPASDFDALIVRTMPPGTLEQVVLRMNLLAAIEASGVLVVNPAKAIECAVDKGLTSLKLAEASLPVPDTAVCESSEQAMCAFHEFGRDVVVKPIFGAEGRGILRVTDEQMAWRTFRTVERLQAAIYVQKFINGRSGDLRVLVLDGQVVASMKRFPADGDFRSNAAQQGSAAAWEASEEESSLAIKAAKVTGCLFAGIDLMYSSDGDLQVIEVNAVPGWKTLEKHTSVNVPLQLIQWLADRIQQQPDSGLK